MNLHRTARARALAVLAGGLTLTTTLLAGCGNGLQSTAPGSGPVIASPSTGRTTPPAGPTAGSASTDAKGNTPVTTPSSSRSAQPGASAPDTSDTSSTSSTSSRSDRCTTGHLQVGVRATQGGAAAGSDYVLLTYRNTGDAGCVLTGYPGVSFVGDSNGTQLGAPAARSRAVSSKPVWLATGRTTTSLLQIANAGDYDPRACVPTTADGFRVFPPGSTAAAFVAFRAQACQQPTGSSPQLVASPVGTRG